MKPALALTLCFSLLLPTRACAHNSWANGAPVPAWVKASCCGPADAHHLTPAQVHDYGDYYLVDGYQSRIPRNQALPSQDGDYWIFYRQNVSPTGTSQSGVYCFFVPMEF